MDDLDNVEHEEIFFYSLVFWELDLSCFLQKPLKTQRHLFYFHRTKKTFRYSHLVKKILQSLKLVEKWNDYENSFWFKSINWLFHP